MTNEEILRAALRQSAYDMGCRPEDFTSGRSIVSTAGRDPRARKYLDMACECELVSYGENIVALASGRLAEAVERYINAYPVEHCFEPPQLYALDEQLQARGMRVCFMAEYFLPDMASLRALPCAYELRVLHQADFAPLYTPQWSNALCEKRRELDVLGVGAYDGDRLIGLAGCSADCEDMLQIGVDVLPAYRRQGVASALTSRLAMEALAIGKVPFYCAVWSNVRSVRNALRCGFRPAWVQMGSKPGAFVEESIRL